jgi:hypothetical protein
VEIRITMAVCAMGGSAAREKVSENGVEGVRDPGGVPTTQFQLNQLTRANSGSSNHIDSHVVKLLNTVAAWRSRPTRR